MTFAELQNEAQKIYKRARAEAERVEGCRDPNYEERASRFE